MTLTTTTGSRRADRLLAILAGRPGHVFTKDELLRATRLGSTRELDSAAVHLRIALTGNASDPRRCENVWGVGYRLTVPDAAPVCECGAPAILHKGYWQCDEPTCSGYGEILREARADEVDRAEAGR